MNPKPGPTPLTPDGGMSAEEYFSRPIPVSTEPEDVARAIRYMEWWLPVGRGSIGSATVHAVKTLMQYARDNSPTPVPSFTCPRCQRTSHNPSDVDHGYCGACHAFTRDPS